MRLQVFLSRAGISSRRASADIIRSGRVTVNGKKVYEPSFGIDAEKDRIYLDTKEILPKKYSYLILYKPKGVTTTKKDFFAEKTVMDLLPKSLSHLNPVGRLDKDTTGLILLTNDGELINRLTHPRFNVEKVYIAGLDRRLSSMDKARLEKGVIIDKVVTAPCAVTIMPGNFAEMTMHEGRKRQVKRMFAALGYKVISLKRIKEGFLSLGSLKEGEWRYLADSEVKKLTAYKNFKNIH